MFLFLLLYLISFIPSYSLLLFLKFSYKYLLVFLSFSRSSLFLSQYAIDSFGLSGIDRLLSFMLVHNLQAIGRQYRLLYAKDRGFAEAVQALQKGTEPLSALLGKFLDTSLAAKVMHKNSRRLFVGVHLCLELLVFADKRGGN